MQRKFRNSLIAGAAALLLLSGCAAEPGEENVTPPGSPSAAGSEDAPATDTVAEEPAPPEPRVQAESCDWDATEPAEMPLPTAPTDQVGDLKTVIIGAWQHTHADMGGGFDPIDMDIRFVFPSPERLLYCQHVPSITDYAENAVDFTWDGNEMVLPGGAPGYVVVAWDDDSMVWDNNLDGSRFLLQRR